jgi:phosphoribosylglycinamide formyltransferase-1
MYQSRGRVAILASGEGTTAEAFMLAGLKDQRLPEVSLIISNNEHAGIFKRVEHLCQAYGVSIETRHIGSTNYPRTTEVLAPGDQTRAEESALLKTLLSADVDVVLLLGYMKKVGPRLVHAFGWRQNYTSSYQARMLNTHPGLLPETKGLYGLHVQEYALAQHAPYAGQTLHIVSENYDEGPVIAAHKIVVEVGDTPESLFERVKRLEKTHIVADVAHFISQRRQFIKKTKGEIKQHV